MNESKTIVLLHGFPFNRSMWDEQIKFLSAHGYRALAPDLRGLGENRVHDEISTMEDMARDVAAQMDEAKIERPVICGLSMGCYVAFDFIHLFPTRTNALVLAGGRAEGPDKAEKQSREQQAKRVLESGFAPSVESILQSLMAPQTLNEKPQVVARVREMVAKTDPAGAAAAQRGMAARRDYRGDLAHISVPTLIIAGRDDGVRKPIDAETIHHGIKNSQLEIIPNAGHLMNMEQPVIFNSALLEFLARLI
jgi:pimeloyl-ACP methyl ester carboxylesterase